MADAAIRGQPQMVCMPGLHDPGVVDPEKQAGTGKGRALRDQGLHQRLRLGAGLAADDSVAGSNYTSEIDHRSDYDRREMSGCDSAHGAYPQRLHGPAGQRRDAAAGARADEMGGDERELAAGAVRFRALEASGTIERTRASISSHSPCACATVQASGTRT